ncbi:MAG: sensor histidine kinase [Candidatus Cyclobacteriaceae bacterium M3_2C_046]
MDFSDFRVNITLRVIIIALTIYLLTHLIYRDAFFITILLVLILVIYQVISLINFLNKTNKEINTFFNSIKNNDFSQTYAVNEDGTYLDILKSEFNMVMRKLTEIRAEKDAQYQYLKNIVQHVGIGILTFKRSGDIQIINTAAKKLFKVEQINNINELRDLSSILVESFIKLRTGGRALVKIDLGDEVIQLSVYAIELSLQSEEFKLISVQNIHSELEENEMEAWQKLVRVLTHEIMNSVTPISSLANTVEQEMLTYIADCEEGKATCDINLEEMVDMHMAVQTIQKRSDGLIRFVSDFRSLTHIPKPKFKVVSIQELFRQVHILLRHDLDNHKINFIQEITPENLTIEVDPELIQQVLINLIQNAIQAMEEEEEEKLIEIKAYLDDKGKTIISVRDNGAGIEEEAQTKIFIPFFTTKKSGSGIGLSLSRQIMRQHLGTISVRSKLDEGTEFSLKF